jgi:hypothetical protein
MAKMARNFCNNFRGTVMSKCFLSLAVLSLCLGACAKPSEYSESPQPQEKPVVKNPSKALVPIMIGVAGVGIALVAGTAGHAHGEGSSPATDF